MKFVVLDTQGYFSTDFQVKELVIYDGKLYRSWVFKPKILHRDLNEAQKKEVNYVFHNIHGIPYNAGYLDYGQLYQVLQDNLKDVDTVYVKGHVKKDFLIKTYIEKNQDPPNIVNLELSDAPKLEYSLTNCKHHRINISSCSIKNVFVLYNYIVSA